MPHFVISEYVRWGDIDLAGIIRYSAYLRFFELAETEIFRAAGLPFGEVFERFDIWLPRKLMHTEFFSPAILDEQLDVATFFSHIGRTSVIINFEVLSAESGKLHATAHQVLVCVARQTMTKQPLPVELVTALQPFVSTKPSTPGR